MVIVFVKDEAGVKKLIKKYAVTLNSLLSIICFLPNVKSSEDFSSSNYIGYSDDANINATTISNVTTRVTGTINKKILTPLEIAGIVIGAIVGILGVIIAGSTLYHNVCNDKDKEKDKKEELPGDITINHEENLIENREGNRYIYYNRVRSLGACLIFFHNFRFGSFFWFIHLKITYLGLEIA